MFSRRNASEAYAAVLLGKVIKLQFYRQVNYKPKLCPPVQFWSTHSVINVTEIHSVTSVKIYVDEQYTNNDFFVCIFKREHKINYVEDQMVTLRASTVYFGPCRKR